MNEYRGLKVFSCSESLLQITKRLSGIKFNSELYTFDKMGRIIPEFGYPDQHKTYFYNIVCSFDIETSNVVIAGKRVGVMYIWQFLIDDMIVYGRDWESFEGFCRLLCNVLDLAQNVNLHVFVHNLSFEFSYLRSHLYFNLDADSKNVFMRHGKDVLNAKAECGIIFRDSYAMSNKGLEATVEELYLPGVSKLKYDYNVVRTKDTVLSEEELEYCLNDVYLVKRYIDFLLKEYKYVRRIPWTMTGMARRRLREYLAYRMDHEYMDFMKQCRIRDESEFDILNQAMHGGMTFSKTHDDGSDNDNSFYRIFENVFSRDASSFYGSQVVLRKFPWGPPVVREDISYDELWDTAMNDGIVNEDKFIVVSVVLEGVTAKYDHLMPLQYNHIMTRSNPNGVKFNDELSDYKVVDKDCEVVFNRIKQANVLSICCTFYDLLIYDFFYHIDNIKVVRAYVYETKFLPRNLVRYMLELYHLKESAEKESERNIHKTTFNSLCFGAHAMSPCRDEYAVSEQTGKWYRVKKDVKKCIEDYNKTSDMASFIIAVAITAFSRYELFTIMSCMDIESIIYIDTDGIKTIKDYSELFESYNKTIEDRCKYVALKIHHLDIESFKSVKKGCYIGQFLDEGLIMRFCSLSTKKYIMERDGKIIQHISGLPKKAQSFYDFDNFVCGEYIERRGISVPKSFMFPDESLRKESVYISSPVYGVVEDCQGHKTFCKEETSVYISDAPFCLEPFVSDMIEVGLMRRD